MKQQQRRGGVDHQSDASSDRVGALERIRNAYAKKIEELVEDCASNYLALLRAAHISERAQNTKEIFEINVHSTNLVYKGEDLLKLIAELKHDFVLNDLKSIAQEAEEEQKKDDRNEKED